MTYNEAIKYITSKNSFGKKPSLDRMFRIMKEFDNVQDKLKIIHIAGTNGKGSTASIITSILTAAGKRVGKFTSPYIERFNERICAEGNDISDNDVVKYSLIVKSKCDELEQQGFEGLTQFEFITVMALLYFYDLKLDVIVLETGLGGRFDATNIVNPILSVITAIGLDHVEILGDTIEKIAYEKAGIIKKDKIAVIYSNLDKKALKVILKKAEEKNCDVIIPDISKLKILSSIPENEFIYDGIKYKLNLKGGYQIFNCISAIEAVNKLCAAENIKFSDEIFIKGVKNAYIPARLEKLCNAPLFYVDGSHNPQGMYETVNFIKEISKNKKIKTIISMLYDKNYTSCLEILSGLNCEFICTKSQNSRAVDMQKLYNVVKKSGSTIIINNPEDALKYAFENSKSGDIILCIGSLYLAGEIKKIWRYKRQNYDK